MEKLSKRLKGARGAELFLIAAILASLALMLLGGKGENGVRTDLEARLEKTLRAVEGAGEMRVMIAQGEDGTVQGVLVVCEGADSLPVRLTLQSAVKTLLDVEMSRIEIAKMSP